VAAALLLAVRGVEPVRSWLYHFAWLPTLAAAAGGLAWRAEPPFPRGLRFVLSLAFWSGPVWYLFELLNLRVANWYYVSVASGPLVRLTGSFTAFATVLPALYLGHRWASSLGLASGWRRPTFRVGTGHRLACLAGGVAFLGLALWRPAAFYPLVWGALTLLLEPWNLRVDPAGSLLGDLSRGRYARPIRLLAGGLAVGVLWEGYNSLAEMRWIYTVPGMETLKWFEMPPLGFLGFPVLALDGFVVYRALANAGLAVRGWDEEDPAGKRPAETGGESRVRAEAAGARGGGASLRPASAGAAALLALLFCVGVQRGVDRYTVDSRTPRIEELPSVSAGEARALRAAGLGRPEDLAGLDSTRVAGRAGLAPSRAGALVRAARLVDLRGLGTSNARALWEAGVRSVCELAEARPEAVSAQVARRRPSPRAGHLPRVRVWIRAARARCDRPESGAGGHGPARSLLSRVPGGEG